MALTLKGVKLLQLNAWPTGANGKLSHKALAEAAPSGHPIHRRALEFVRSRVYVLAAGRSVIAPRGGALSHLDEAWLGAGLIKELLKEAQVRPEDLGGLLVGNALAAGGNPARRLGLALGLGQEAMSLSVDSQCCSGLDAIGLGMAVIRAGSHHLVIAGGVESASNAPLRQWTARDSHPGWRQAPFTPWPHDDPDMVAAALRLAEARGIDSQMQYDWAIQSHKLARQNKDPSLRAIADLALEKDPHTRALTIETCRRAERAKPHNPTTMAPIADGAAFMILASELYLREHSAQGRLLRSITELCDHKAMASDHQIPGLACGVLKPWLLDQMQAQEGWQGRFKVELMESFAAQAIANVEDLNLGAAEVNAWGHACMRPPYWSLWRCSGSQALPPLKPRGMRPGGYSCGRGLASGLFARCHTL